METDFTVSVSAQPPGAVVTVAGELDVATSELLESELAKLQDAATVIVDLRAVRFIDSTGLGVLIRHHQLAKERGARFGLTGVTGQVQRLLGLTGLDAELLVADSPEQLLAGE